MRIAAELRSGDRPFSMSLEGPIRARVALMLGKFAACARSAWRMVELVRAELERDGGQGCQDVARVAEGVAEHGGLLSFVECRRRGAVYCRASPRQACRNWDGDEQEAHRAFSLRTVTQRGS